MSGTIRAFLPGGTDRLANAIQHLQEILDDEADGKPVGLVLQWKTVEAGGGSHFFHSIFGEVLESDIAYFSVILAARAVRRPAEG